MAHACEKLASEGFIVAAPEFGESLSASFDPNDQTTHAAVLKATRTLVEAAWSTPIVGWGCFGHSMGAFAVTDDAKQTTWPMKLGRVPICGIHQDGYTGNDPLLVIASKGDGVIPASRVEERLKQCDRNTPSVSEAEIRAQGPQCLDAESISSGGGSSVSGPYRAALFMDTPCHVSFISPATNAAMQSLLGPLLPLARCLKVRLLDFDVYQRTQDAEETAKVFLPVLLRFFDKNERGLAAANSS
jgi:hypothetical protein